jgi:hypothetical protein
LNVHNQEAAREEFERVANGRLRNNRRNRVAGGVPVRARGLDVHDADDEDENVPPPHPPAARQAPFVQPQIPVFQDNPPSFLLTLLLDLLSHLCHTERARPEGRQASRLMILVPPLWTPLRWLPPPALK